jgi:hypothetical protein
MTDSIEVFHNAQTSIKAAFTELEQKNLCESWPIERTQFESRTGKWKSNIIDFTSLPGVDETKVTLGFGLLSAGSTWDRPTQRKLILLLTDFSFVTDELYSDRLNQAVLDFLDSPLLHNETRILSPATDNRH